MVPFSRQLLLSLVVVTLAVSASPLLSGAVVGNGTVVESESDSEEPDIENADTATISVTLDEDGDAEWTVEYRYVLDSSDSIEAFETIKGQITENPETYEERFREGIMQTAEIAMEETGREMSVGMVDVTVGTDPIPQASGQHGVISYAFDWAGFAKTEEQELTVGDAISGFYLSEETALVLSWPELYELGDDPRPSGDDEDRTRVVWEGEERFSATEPAVTLEPVEETANVSENDTDTASGPTDESDEETATDSDSQVDTTDETSSTVVGDPSQSSRSPLVIALVVISGIAGAVGFVVARRPQWIYTISKRHTDPEETAGDLLSNEERVLAALEAEGGRIKQKQLAERCDWHPSKTSKVVTSMKEDGAVNVFRIGRENIITHPDEQLGETDEQ